MKITKYARERLRLRFGITGNVEEEIHRRISESKLMTQRDVNRCGTKCRRGFVYLKSGKMILVCSKNVLVNVLWFDNPYQRLKGKLKCQHPE